MRMSRLLPSMFAAIDVQSDPGDLAIVVPLNSIIYRERIRLGIREYR